MIAFGLPEDVATRLAVPGGEPPSELHLTLAYICEDVDQLPDPAMLNAAATAFSLYSSPIDARVTGFGILENPDDPEASVAVALVDVPGLDTWRGRLLTTLKAFGIYPLGTHGFIPHITLAYGTTAELMKMSPPELIPMILSSIAVATAGEVQHLPLLGYTDPEGRISFMKADDEKRYTFSPLYAPGRDDSHGEYVTADDLQQGTWDYVRRGNFEVNWQHFPSVRAGECVEIVSWPYPVSAQMMGTNGVQKVDLPANTVFQGVVWDEWAWPLVKSGHITGLSLEGRAFTETDDTTPTA